MCQLRSPWKSGARSLKLFPEQQRARQGRWLNSELDTEREFAAEGLSEKGRAAHTAIMNRAAASKNTSPMRILVVLANYGTKNDSYLRRLVQEYASMSHDVHVVVLTNVAKNLGDQVEVVVKTPRGDPWSFPFAHKEILAKHLNDYDLFIYSEDDTLLTEQNINAFLSATEVLPPDEIAGFLRLEKSPDGAVSFSTVHGYFRWDPRSVVARGDYTFAFFTNEHAACYILTRSQLRRAIDSGGFLVGPHQEKYDLLVTAATDPYTQCGLRKVICISNLRDFVLPHLPNRYVGQLGLGDHEFYEQVRALQEILNKERPAVSLLNREKKAEHYRWSKSLYEPVRQDILDLIPTGAQRLLSYGCGSGAIEAELMKRGIRVTGIPLDSVIAVTAQAKGVEVICGDSETALEKLSAERFDCILLTNILHLIPDPSKLLASLASLLAPGGCVVATLPNLNYISILRQRAVLHPAYRCLGNHEQSGVNLASPRAIRKWFTRAQLKPQESIPVVPQRFIGMFRALGGWLSSLLAEEFLILAKKQ